MAGNAFGKLFSVTTYGESHGEAIGCIVDGCPPNIELNENDIQPDLNRRKPGQSRYTTQRREDDEVVILSGTFEGKTTGTPIGLLVKNEDQKQKITVKSEIYIGHLMQIIHMKRSTVLEIIEVVVEVRLEKQR